jgi:hypothetical protein
MRPIPILIALASFLFSSVFGAGNQFYSTHITTNTTTTPATTTVYLKTIVITCTAVGTTETLVIKNKEGTPKTIYQSPTLTLGTSVFAFDTAPIQSLGGIDIVTAGSGAATVDVFLTYE